MIWDILFKVWKKGSSFSGENEYISVSNSVIILDGKNEICYGGDLKTTNLSGEENTYQVQLKTPNHEGSQKVTSNFKFNKREEL